MKRLIDGEEDWASRESAGKKKEKKRGKRIKRNIILFILQSTFSFLFLSCVHGVFPSQGKKNLWFKRLKM